jgi:hypothetical protein
MNFFRIPAKKFKSHQLQHITGELPNFGNHKDFMINTSKMQGHSNAVTECTQDCRPAPKRASVVNDRLLPMPRRFLHFSVKSNHRIKIPQYVGYQSDVMSVYGRFYLTRICLLSILQKMADWALCLVAAVTILTIKTEL